MRDKVYRVVNEKLCWSTSTTALLPPHPPHPPHPPVQVPHSQGIIVVRKEVLGQMRAVD